MIKSFKIFKESNGNELLLNDILDKISNKGIDSLKDDERKFLNTYDKDKKGVRD